MKRSLSLLLALIIVLTMLPACTKEKAPAPTSAPDQMEDSTKTEVPEYQSASAERQITDMAGRTVTIPAHIDSVFSTGTVTAIYLYTLVPDLLLGWNYDLNEIEKSIILEKYHSLPNFGQKDAINYEAVIAAGPAIALNIGTINDKMISDCNSFHESTGIPVIAVDGDLMKVPEAYRFMGELFGVQERAELLASYAEKTFEDIEAMNISEEKKVRVYYGNGEDSLETPPKGSSHAQVLDMVRAVNVADLELGDGSRVQISAEQLLAWNPDVIVVNGEPKSNFSGGSAADALMADPILSSLTAVQEEKVFGTPNAPFSWVDRPPGPNRIIGIRWLSGLLYPEYLNFDVDAEVREFFKLFYHVELTDEQLQKVYNGEI